MIKREPVIGKIVRTVRGLPSMVMISVISTHSTPHRIPTIISIPMVAMSK